MAGTESGTDPTGVEDEPVGTGTDTTAGAEGGGTDPTEVEDEPRGTGADIYTEAGAEGGTDNTKDKDESGDAGGLCRGRHRSHRGQR